MSVVIHFFNTMKPNHENPLPASDPGAPTRPIEPPLPQTRRSRLLFPSLALGLPVFVFILLGLLFLRDIARKNELKAAAKAQAEAAAARAALKPVDTKPAGVVAVVGNPVWAGGGTNLGGGGMMPAAPRPEPLRLQAVFFSPTRPSAMVGGKTVRPGDRVGTFTVTGITPDSVTLASGSQTKVLRLSQ
jgi:hypothetical protein